MNKTVYVTGANGFIGQNIVEYLASLRYEVYAVLRPGSIPGFSLHQNVHIVYADLTDKKSLVNTIPRGAMIINLAANPYHKTLSYVVNIEGTRNLVEASVSKRVTKFIQISSQATKIKQQGVYALTKNASDQIVRDSQLDYVILKPSLVYGGGEKGLFNKIRSLANVLPYVPVFGDGETKLYPIEVGDFAILTEKVLSDPKTDKNEFDVGSKSPVTYNYLYKAILGHSKKVKLLHIPVWTGLLLAKLFSVLPTPPIYEDNVLGSTQDTKCKPLPILKRYKFDPSSFAEGSARVLKPTKIKIAIVGLGKMGTLHMAILNTFAEVEIVALIDTNVALYNTVKSMGIKGNFYTSLEEACKSEKIDAVYIITPTFTHLDLIKTALKYDLHIFVEKPVAMNSAQLSQLRQIKSNKVIHTGYTLLNNRIYQEVARIIRNKTYGKVLSFTGRFEHGEVFGPKNGWMFNKKLSGGGVLMNPGPHFFSILNLFFGKPSRIKGEISALYSIDLDDEVRATLDYADFRGQVFLSWSVEGQHVSKSSFSIKFEKAVLMTDGDKIKVTKNDKSTLVTPTPNSRYSEIFNINPKANGEAYYVENRAFIDAIGGDKTAVPNDLKTALQIESAIFDCYQKSKIVEVSK